MLQNFKILAIILIFILVGNSFAVAQGGMFQNQIPIFNPSLTGKFNSLRMSSQYTQPIRRNPLFPNYRIHGNVEYLAEGINSGFGFNYELNRYLYFENSMYDLGYAYHHTLNKEWSVGAGLSGSYFQTKTVDENANLIPEFPDYGEVTNRFLALNGGVYGSYNDLTLGVGMRNVLGHYLDTAYNSYRTVSNIQLRYDFSVGQRWIFSTINQMHFGVNNNVLESNLIGTRNGNFWWLAGYKRTSWNGGNNFVGGIGIAAWKRVEVGYIQHLIQLPFNESSWGWGNFELTLSYRIPTVNRASVTCGFCIEIEED
jgi:hypothetical protein